MTKRLIFSNARVDFRKSTLALEKMSLLVTFIRKNIF